MPSLKDIRAKIETTKNTQQITRAMKMVSAAALRRAQHNIVNLRPYANTILSVIADIAATVRDSLKHIADERGAEIVIERPLPTLVGDRLAIEQILSNLVENAVKYSSPDRAGRIVIRGRSERDRRIVEVADNGRGIAESDHARIFDLFRRSGPQDQPGEGIGLAHVRALVYRLGGTIDVASTLGIGTIFTLSLPAQLSDTGPTS